jgi:hypothetical protein
MTVLRRRYPGIRFMRGVEPQDGKRILGGGPGRLALHDHFLLWSPVPIGDREIRVLAMQAGFGHSSKWVPVMPGSKREIYYVSKYIGKASDQRRQVPWRVDEIDRLTGELHEGVVVPGRYRTWSTSRNWGLTLTQARHQAYARFLDRELEMACGLLSVTLGARSLPPPPAPAPDPVPYESPPLPLG